LELLGLEKIFKTKTGCTFTLPLEKGYPLCLNKLESSPPKNWPSASGADVVNVKVTDRQTDRQATCEQKSSLEFSAQVS
jgi:hypothetical protein